MIADQDLRARVGGGMTRRAWRCLTCTAEGTGDPPRTCVECTSERDATHGPHPIDCTERDPVNGGWRLTARAAPIAHTIDLLRRCQRARAAGHPVWLTTDPAWLVNAAINRRAGWSEDPWSREVYDGPRMPRLATGENQGCLYRTATAVNARVRVRVHGFGNEAVLRYLLRKIPHRFTYPEDL